MGSGTGTHKIITADGPLKLKEASRYSIEFAVEVGLGKYRYHLPLDRQAHLLGEQGLCVSSQVLFEQVETVAWYLGTTLMKGIEDNIKKASVNEADDTFWKTLESLKKRTKSSFFLWGVRNPAGFHDAEPRDFTFLSHPGSADRRDACS